MSLPCDFCHFLSLRCKINTYCVSGVTHCEGVEGFGIRMEVGHLPGIEVPEGPRECVLCHPGTLANDSSILIKLTEALSSFGTLGSIKIGTLSLVWEGEYLVCNNI